MRNERKALPKHPNFTPGQPEAHRSIRTAGRRGSVTNHAHPHHARLALPASDFLTTRERQVVGLVSQAKLNKEIAHALNLTEGTVKEYLNRIFRKVVVSNRTELALWAIRNPGLVFVSEGDCG